MKIKKVLMSLVSILKWEKKIPIVSIKASNNLLDGKVALVTGGSGGIGMAIAKSLIDSGCKVIIAGTNEQKLKQSIEILQNDAKYVILNMNDISSFRDKINSVVSIFGHIELFVNSAGVHSENFDFWNMTECEYDRVMDINLKGVYFFAQSAAAPGSTATNLLGYKKGDSIYSDDNSECRMIMPEEVGNLTNLLLSDAGNMINGEIIHISSGRGIYDIR